MFRVCAWCDIFIGVSTPMEDPSLTHGICSRCAERVHREEAPRLSSTLIIVDPRRTDLCDRLGVAFHGMPDVSVILDQRRGERRRARNPVEVERRRDERRRLGFRSQREAWRLLGVRVVQ